MSVAGAGPAAGQPAAPPALAPVAVPSPTYVSLELELAVSRPAEEVWARIGRYCDLQEWLGMPCVMTSGVDGELGSVRTINGVIPEILVAKTPLSYTYTQPVRVNTPYNLYHGTLEVRPVTATTSRIVYNLMWDNSMLADDAAREREKARYKGMFDDALNNMKILAEGGTLPPAPARGGPGAPGGAPRGGPGAPGAPGAGGPAAPGGF